MNFSELALAEPIARALAEKGYTEPSPIQAAAIPPALAGNDVMGLAQTGTGKTAAFALPMLQRLAANPKHRLKMTSRALVLAPTRELASQIAASFQAYGKYMKLSVAVVFGGVPIGRQERQMFPGVDVLVATPGRLLDLVMKGAVDLGHVEMLVLDECDQMLDLGFIHDLKRITGLLPRTRQTMLFSATLPPAIEELAGRYLKNPVKIAVQPAATTVEKVTQAVIHVSQTEKLALLAHLLGREDVASAIVFSRTKHGADRVVRQLAAHRIAAEAIHGNRSQAQRTRALGAFRSGELRVLVATDIAARGIDVPAVSHVFNFELPNVPEQYVHRIGRTARAGRGGQAIALCAPDERPFLKSIERLTRVNLTVEALPANFRDMVGHTAKLIKAAPPAADEGDNEGVRDFARGQPGDRGRVGRDDRAVVRPERGAGPRAEHRAGPGRGAPGGGPGRFARSGEGRGGEGRGGEGRGGEGRNYAGASRSGPGRSGAGRAQGGPQRGR